MTSDTVNSRPAVLVLLPDAQPVSREATWQWLHDQWDWLVATFGGHALEKFPMYAAKVMHGDDWLRRYRDF